ncbi:cysteine--tRNA ligase [Candidatus Uhrbacteria bacterium]|nr:cysteine--tRNA ligase [Candidatus Uhrbacteria bacterium]
MSSLKLYNSLSKEIEPFKKEGGVVKMYSCGPTVYDFAHIGNLRSFVAVDVLRRYLEYGGYKVRQVMNITDVGHQMADAEEGLDKIEEAARLAKTSPKQIAEKFTQAFFNDINALNIKPAWKYPRASAHIKEMIKMIEKLIRAGYGYKDGCNVYYEVRKFSDYGKLSGNTLENLLAGARVAPVSGKKEPFDFALWICKAGHLMTWKAPWGEGYPGWHLECSAMAEKYLGKTIDIHTGGEDNKFPHHEAEIAQSEAANGAKFSRYFLHVTHLLVDGEKMSKSLGNFYTLNDITSRGFSPRELRYLLISVHYRDPLNFTWESLDSARVAISRIDEFAGRLDKPKAGNASMKSLINETREEYLRAMDNDLNTSKALAALHNFARKGNALLDYGVKRSEAKAAAKLLREMGSTLGIGFKKREAEKVPTEAQKLVREREEARKKGDFKQADELRQKIKELGFKVEDAATGPKIKKA